MTVVGEFPFRIREIETCWIPMADGTRLAARMWLPEDAEDRPVPAILEYIPYRRRDATRDGDDLTHPYLAGHGYACIRLDIRGTGDSDGVIRDEYLKQEQDDALEAIAWIAAQPWCSGAVGMMGISWGGFNSLQVAARRPPALEAIVTACSTDDRYADDMHYMGGCVITDTHAWGASFFGRMARPPDPIVVGEDRWRDMWRQRLEGWDPPFVAWLEHQRRDAYWQHGSICEDFAAIRAAVFAVGGWADGYSNAIFRLLAGLRCPRLGLIGPWGHKYPHAGMPGPAIGFLQESLRWWDHWLKGRDTGIMREPMLRAWQQDSVAPSGHYDVRPGRWIGEPAWPSPRIATRILALRRDGLGDEAGPEAAMAVRSPQTTGIHAGEWCPYGMGGLAPEMPLDQREEDGKSLVFDSAPLPADLPIFGAPAVTLDLAADRPAALIAVRLNDVAADGASTRVTYGLLNLTHREGHVLPKPLKPGERCTVRLALNEIGYTIPQGHRLRVAISTAYWPIAWPSPEPVALTVRTGASRLELPVREPRPEDARIGFAEAATAPPTRRRFLRPASVARRIERDIATGETVSTVLRDDGRSIIEAIGVETELRKLVRFRIKDDDPTSARMEIEQTFVHAHPGWSTRVETRSALACTEAELVVEADLAAYEDDLRIFARSWTRRIPRDLV